MCASAFSPKAIGSFASTISAPACSTISNHLLDKNGFELLRHDVTIPLDLDVTEIFNLACPASPQHYQADPVHTMSTCVIGSLNLLNLCRRSQARIFQASTSEIYGEPMVHPQTEDYWGHANPIGVRACYDEGKRAAETFFFDHHRQYGVAIKVGRLFNTYGPRMHDGDGRVVPNFIVQALQQEPITIYGDGSQTRSFCYVDDVVDGILRLMRSPGDVTGPMNLGRPEEITIATLAETIVEMTGSRSSIVLKPLPSDDPTRRCPDISRAVRQLGWEPSVSLRDGLQHTIGYFEDALRSGQRRQAS